MVSKVRVATLMPIKNMDRALKFYTKSLGAKLRIRGEGDMKDGWAAIQLGGDWVWLIVPQKREKRSLAYSTILTTNIKSFVKGLKQKGVKFQRAQRLGPDTRIDGPIAYEPFGAAAFFKDTEGNLLMVWQNNPPM